MMSRQQVSSRRRTAAVILAAGASSRLGQPKQLLHLDGRPLLQHVVDAAAEAELDPLVVVLGAAADDVRAVLHLPPNARIAVNRDVARGMSASLRAGLDELPAGVEAAAVLLGDQPTISAESIRAVVNAAAAVGTPITRPRYRGEPGHPVVLARSAWPLLAGTDGDAGARGLMDRHPELVTDIELGIAPPPDVDTREDYQRLLDR